MVQASVATMLTFSLLLSLPMAAWSATPLPHRQLTVQFERALHFHTPGGDAVIVPSGTYAVKAEGHEARG